jgi:preprotein translocase subunit SecG
LLYLVLFIVFVILSLVIGYIDTKIGIREEEQKNYTEQNPVITDIHKIVKELKEKSRN